VEKAKTLFEKGQDANSHQDNNMLIENSLSLAKVVAEKEKELFELYKN